MFCVCSTLSHTCKCFVYVPHCQSYVQLCFVCSTLSIIQVNASCSAPPSLHLFTRVDVHDALAHFALNVATPVELAATAFRYLRLSRAVATAAAHQVAAGYAIGVPVAPSTHGPERTRLGVLVAVVRRLFQIHEVLLVNFTEA